MQFNTIEPLEWDSNFFGYPVARVFLDKDGNDSIDDIFRELASEKYRLTYFFVSPTEEELMNYLVKKGAKLVDQKVFYSKSAENHNHINHNIIEFQGEQINERLKALVLQAGLFSRYRLDDNFTNNEYERLYVEWLTKSLNKTIAFKTLVATKGYDINGLIILGKKGHHGDISLAAVDPNYRGQGLGYDLFCAADNLFYDMGFEVIKTVTQMKNTGACKLYEKCNFHIEKISNVYHYWQK